MPNYLSNYAAEKPTVQEYVNRMQSRVPERTMPPRPSNWAYWSSNPMNLLQLLGVTQAAPDPMLDRRLGGIVNDMRARNEAMRQRLERYPAAVAQTQPRTL